MGAAVDRLEAEKDDVAGVVVTSAKKTFFAGGDLRRMVEAGPDDAPVGVRDGARTSRPSCAASRPSAGRSSPRSTARRSAAAWRSRWPATTGSPSTTRTTEIGLPEVTLGLLPGGGGVTRVVRMLGLASGLMDVLLTGARFKPAAGAGEGPPRRARRRPATSWSRPRRRGSSRTATTRRPPPSRGTAPATGCPAARRRPPSWPRSCRRSRPTCASRPRARTTRRRGRSCPRPSRVRRSTSRPRPASSPAT